MTTPLPHADSTHQLQSILERVLPSSATMQYESMGSSGDSRVHNGNVYNITIVLSPGLGTGGSGPETERAQPRMDDEAPQVSSAQQAKQVEEKTYTITPDDVLIAVMGITGCGKSTFVNHLADYTVSVGIGLESGKRHRSVHTGAARKVLPATLPGSGKRIYLMDTPGFDDTDISDRDVLTNIATWLTSTYQNSIKLTGLIYLHPIRDNRFKGSALRNMRMFSKLCGGDALGKVVLATTMWDITDEETAVRRESELEHSDKFSWKVMIERGSRLFRHDNGAMSAQAIIEHLISLQDPAVLALQREMVDEALPLKATSAGKELLEELQQRYEDELQQLRTELAEARAVNDSKAADLLKKVVAESEDVLKRPSQSFAASMDSTAQDLYTGRINSPMVSMIGRMRTASPARLADEEHELRPRPFFSGVMLKLKSWSDRQRQRIGTKASQRTRDAASG